MLIRIGKYSGKIYSEDYDLSKINECCILITGEEKDLAKQRTQDILDCFKCGGCPAAKQDKSMDEVIRWIKDSITSNAV